MPTVASPLVLGRRSSLGRKMIMALTGGLLFGWTVLHLGGNLLVFAGADTMNGYGAVLQRSPLVWAMRAGLLLLVGWHVGEAFATWRSARRASGEPGARRRHRATTFSARAMRVGGLLLGVFVVYHLLHIYGVAHADYRPGDVHHNLVSGLRSPWVAAAYLGATFVLCSHLRHGLDSAPRSLGVAPRSRGRGRFALAVSLLVGLGFAAPCVAALLGWV